MPNRTCEYCGAPTNLLREGARFCSAKCRVYTSRKAKLPAAMTGKARWMRWELVARNGRTTKRPVTVGGRQASSTNAATWCDFRTAKASTVGAGLGFALGEGIGCVDLDHCLTDGVVADWAQDILDRCPSTYIEVSQSKTGLHIFGYLPEGPGRNIRRGDTAVEFYSAGRFIAVTGERFGSAPSVLADLSEVVASVS